VCRFIALALALLTATFAGCEADKVVITSCHGSCCSGSNCHLHGGDPVVEPIPAGTLVWADVAAPAIWRMTPDGGPERIAGTGEAGASSDGAAAAAAPIGPPEILGVDARDGGLVFRELSSGAVRKIDADGRLSTVR